MLQVTLQGWLSQETWRVALVFARVGTAFFMLPGYGEPGVPGRIRLFASIAVSVAIAAALGPMPAAPANVWGLLLGVLPDMMTGALLGGLSRITISAVLAAGAMISQSINLNNIFAAGIGFEQSAVVGTMINVGLLATLFATDAHHLILRALVGSYDVVGPGLWPDIAASTRAVVNAVAKSFELAIQLSMPFLLLGLLFNASLALVNRAMPQMPVFQIGAPALLLVGLYLLVQASSALVERAVGAYVETLGMLR